MTVFSMFIWEKKQNCSGVSHPCLHQGIALGPLGGLQLPPDPQVQLFLALPKTNAPIFFLYYSEIRQPFKIYLTSVSLNFNCIRCYDPC